MIKIFKNILNKPHSVENTTKLVKTIFLVYFIGAVGFIMPITHDLFVILTPLNLIFSFVVLFYAIRFDLKKWHWIIFILIYILGFGIEVVGVNTGWPFGEYEYGSVLGIKAFNTPLLIGVNWLMLILATHLLVSKYVKNRILIPFLAATLMLVFDFALEPFAIFSGMWLWEMSYVPFDNYFAWWLISLVMHLLFLPLKFTSGFRVGKAVFFSQLIFFLVVILFNMIF